MRKVLAVTVLVCAAVTLCSNPAEAQRFSLRALNGNYAIILSGWDVTNNTPVSLSGVMQFNRRGAVVGGSVSYNDGGIFCSFPNFLPSTYYINPDGTGTLNLVLDSASARCASPPITNLNLALALFKNGRQANISTQGITADTVVLSGTLSMQKMFP